MLFRSVAVRMARGDKPNRSNNPQRPPATNKPPKKVFVKGGKLMTSDNRQVKTNFPIAHKGAQKANSYKVKHPNVSVEEAFARTSSLAPTRLALNIKYGRLFNFLQNVATLMTYHIQSKGIVPKPNDSTDESNWNPSLLLCYLVSIVAGRLQKIGATNASSSVQVMSNYLVPTFFAKWLQQIGPCYHMARLITPVLDETVDSMLNTNCGTSGIGNTSSSNSGWLDAAVFIQTSGDTEGWWSVDGTNITPLPINYPINQQSSVYSKISSVISKTFDHVIAVGKIPDGASNAELKCTPVADSEYGQFMFTVLDPNLQCDLLLPLCQIYTNDLINSTLSTIIPAPVRVDGGLCIAPEAKFAFMFHLANKFPFKPKHSFTSYLDKFGLRSHLRPNAVINIRQINWGGVMLQCLEYLKTLSPNATSETAWHLFIYCMTVLVSNIPGAFRAISPVQRDWSIAPLYKSTAGMTNYSSYARNPKIPPFIASLVKALREPIRYENEVTFYTVIMPPANSGFWWWNAVGATSNTNYNTGGQYGTVPSTIYNTGIVLYPGGVGSYYPYQGFLGTNSPIGDGVRNYLPIFGLGNANAEFQGTLVQTNGNLNLYNGWLSKAVNFTRRHAKYYIVSNLDGGTPISYPVASGKYLSVPTILVKQIMSNEPATHHSAILALVHMLSYYTPSDLSVAMAGPTFSAQPVAGSETATSGVMSTENPAQGSSTSIMIAKSSNPAEVTGHLGADAASDIVPDSSQQPPPELHKQVMKKVTNKLETACDDISKVAGDFIGKAISAI